MSGTWLIVCICLLDCFCLFQLQYWFSIPRAETLNAYISHNETLGSSPTGRGFRAKANYYVTEEDLVAIAINGPWSKCLISPENSQLYPGQWPVSGHWWRGTVAADGVQECC